MRVLFATGSPAHYMLPPQLGDEQVTCGPDWPDEREPDGRVRSLRTAIGEYDLAAIAAKLPAEQQPDLVACLVDASWRNLPRNLGAFRCPRVLLVADTHHMNDPLMGTMRYLIAEAYDRVVLLYDRHHAGFFVAAGVQNLFWFPGLTFPHPDASVRAARRPAAERAGKVAFVGQTGRFHPRRTALLEALVQQGVPVETQAIPQREAAAFYGAALVGFNASLNGDLNLRVFEILAAGGALLTDRLAVESGLEQLFTDGRELATYGDVGELAALAADLLADPRRASAMGAVGAAWFDTHLNESRRRQAFQTLAFDGIAPAPFQLPPALRERVYFGGDTDRLLQCLMVYEGVQELHRQQETVRVVVEEGAPGELREIYVTLPRVEVTGEPGQGADLGVFRTAHAEQAILAQASSLWFWDATGPELDALTTRLASAGLAPASDQVAVFLRAAPAEMLVRAQALWRQGHQPAAFDLAHAALERDPRSAEACLLLAEIALHHHVAPLAEKMLRRALDLRPDDPTIRRAFERQS